MNEELKIKAAALRKMGVTQNLPQLVEVLDGLTDEIQALSSQRDQVVTQALQDQTAERNRQAIKAGIDHLSFSELEAIKHIMHELTQTEDGLLVASQVADRMGITRSVIVNALRKLESAGILEARSLGMKGTHIKILIPEFTAILAH